MLMHRRGTGEHGMHRCENLKGSPVRQRDEGNGSCTARLVFFSVSTVQSLRGIRRIHMVESIGTLMQQTWSLFVRVASCLLRSWSAEFSLLTGTCITATARSTCSTTTRGCSSSACTGNTCQVTPTRHALRSTCFVLIPYIHCSKVSGFEI